MGRPRSRSNLGADPRGDTGAPAMATMDQMSPISSAPGSPSTTPYSSTDKLVSTRKSNLKRRKAKSIWRRYKDITFRHTWVNPLLLVLVVLSAYSVNPTPSNPLHSAIFISYALPKDDPSSPTMYGKGALDFAFVAFYTIVLSFTREFLMQRFIRGLAIYCGMRGRARISRFMEQIYTAMYFAIFGPLGLYVMSRTPVWYFNTTAMFEGYPHKTHEGVFKSYYLLQASYWTQQAIVLLLQLEKPRKDFKELVGHHIITIALIWLSYRFHFTYMGVAVYITHDISDFFLATSKTLNYIDSVIIGPFFASFIGVWIYMRHYLNLCILWAVLTTFKTVGPFELNWDTQQYKCTLSQFITFGLLASLQAVNLFWLWFILRIAWKYASKAGLADERSDDEGEGEEGIEKEKVDEINQKENGIMKLTNGSATANGNANGNVNGNANGNANGHRVGPKVLVNGHPVGYLKANGDAKVPAKKEGKKKL